MDCFIRELGAISNRGGFSRYGPLFLLSGVFFLCVFFLGGVLCGYLLVFKGVHVAQVTALLSPKLTSAIDRLLFHLFLAV